MSNKVSLQDFITDNKDLLLVFGVFTALGSYFANLNVSSADLIASASFVLAGYIGLIILANYDDIKKEDREVSLNFFFFLFVFVVFGLVFYIWDKFNPFARLILMMIGVSVFVAILAIVFTILNRKK